MAVNSTKTKFIIFRTKGKYLDNDNISIYFNDNKPNVIDDPNLYNSLTRVSNNPNPADQAYKLPKLGSRDNEAIKC
jgi:hypothetical protein